MQRYKHLRMIEADSNHNKEYIMEQIDDRKFKVSYGRYGSTLVTKIYPMSKWDSLYDEKLTKGYKDITQFKEITVVQNSEYEEIKDISVRSLIHKLMNYANEFIKSSYSIKTAEVTQKMVSSAQALIDKLSDPISLYEFNLVLEQLFTILPRKMKDVKMFLAKDEADREEIVKREQDLLDAMSAKVTQHHRHSSLSSEKEVTILEEMGLEVRPCTDDESEMIKGFMGESADNFDSAFYVSNKETEKKFNDFCKENRINKKTDIHFFYHGSRNENFWSILCNGLKLRPNAKITGKMFGYGIYFAPKAKKSIGYTSLSGSYWARGTSNEGYLAVFKVAYKKPYDAYSFESRFQNFSYKDVAKEGCDALFAHAGTMLRNDEAIVYKEEQATIRYLIKLK